MIYLYYTGAEQLNSIQKEVRLSLGGYPSNTKIPNGSLASIFSDISSYTKNKNTTETICIAIKNEFSETLKNFSLYCEVESEDYEIFAAFVNPSLDKCGNIIFEKLDTNESVPYYAEFNNITGLSNEINIGDFEANTYKGLFLQRKLKNINKSLTSCKAIDYQQQNDNESVENINFLFQWE